MLGSPVSGGPASRREGWNLKKGVFSIPVHVDLHADGKTETVLALHELVLSSLEDDKAEDVVSIDLEGRSQIADYMIIASGRSSRQVSAISEHLTDSIKQHGFGSCLTEGEDAGDWVVVDAGDVIVHLFRPEVREYYNLEKMWAMDMEADGDVDIVLMDEQSTQPQLQLV